MWELILIIIGIVLVLLCYIFSKEFAKDIVLLGFIGSVILEDIKNLTLELSLTNILFIVFNFIGVAIVFSRIKFINDYFNGKEESDG